MGNRRLGSIVIGALTLESWSQFRWTHFPDFAVMFAGRWLAVVSGGWLLFHLVFRRREEEVLLGLLCGSAGMAIAETNALWGFLFLGALVWSEYRKRLKTANKASDPTPENAPRVLGGSPKG